MNILEAMDDPDLFGPFFVGDAWRPWKAFLGTLFGLPLGPSLRAIATQYTQRSDFPPTQFKEGWMVVGRRGGKSRVAALLATYFAAFRDYRPDLAKGEKALIPVLASDMDQAQACFGYASAFFEEIPVLRTLLKSKPTGQRIELKARVEIKIRAATFRGLRGRPIPLAICDEIAFWRNEESLNPDVEILRALTPGMLTIPGSMLIGLSSPYAQRGVLWDRHRKFYGQPDKRHLIWQARTEDMNPTVDRDEIALEYEADPVSAEAEYGAQFRRDVQAYVPREVVEAAVVSGRHRIPPIWGMSYFAFVDPSGGSQDAFSLGIAHVERERVVLDVIDYRLPPFSPETVVSEFATILKQYKCYSVRGDRYAGLWPQEQFTKYGIGYEPCDVPKSDLYVQFLPLLMSGRVELLDNPRLISEFCGLDRKAARGGRDSVDHPPKGHDDVCNAATGALLFVSQMDGPVQATNLRRDAWTPTDWREAAP